MKCYNTLKAPGNGEHIAEKSRFISFAAPVATVAEAEEIIAKIQKQHYNAAHNVYAYLIDAQTKRYTDDGEPQGTAGLPILDMLEKQGLIGVCVVVTRYFGGTLLGTGGLVRAYTAAAKLALEGAGVVTMLPAAELFVSLNYTHYGKLSYMLPAYEVITLNSQFGENVDLTLLVEESKLDAFLNEITETWNGKLVPEIKERYFYNFNKKN